MIGRIVNLWKMVRAVNEKGFCSVLLVLLGDGPTSCAVPPAPILKKYVSEQISHKKFEPSVPWYISTYGS